MNDAAAEILHHGRNRVRLMANAAADVDAIGFEFADVTAAAPGLLAAEMIDRAITPKDETVVSIRSIYDEIDWDAPAEDYESYGPSEISSALAEYVSRPEASALRDGELRGWLNARGVGDDQIEKWNVLSVRAIDDERARIVMGAEIHPALRRWIGHATPSGAIFPTPDENGRPIGCFCRFLSTVPKVKFGASIPGMHVMTNVVKGEDVDAVFFVEGVFDALAVEGMGESGWRFATPSSGAWTPEQIAIALRRISLARRPPAIVMAHDMDRVGAKTNAVVGACFRALGYRVEFAEWDGAKDLAELAYRDGRRKIAERLRIVKFSDVIRRYNAAKYERVVDYSAYLDNRHASYSNSNYAWLGAEANGG